MKQFRSLRKSFTHTFSKSSGQRGENLWASHPTQGDLQARGELIRRSEAARAAAVDVLAWLAAVDTPLPDDDPCAGDESAGDEPAEIAQDCAKPARSNGYEGHHTQRTCGSYRRRQYLERVKTAIKAGKRVPQAQTFARSGREESSTSLEVLLAATTAVSKEKSTLFVRGVRGRRYPSSLNATSASRNLLQPTGSTGVAATVGRTGLPGLNLGAEGFDVLDNSRWARESGRRRRWATLKGSVRRKFAGLCGRHQTGAATPPQLPVRIQWPRHPESQVTGSPLPVLSHAQFANDGQRIAGLQRAEVRLTPKGEDLLQLPEHPRAAPSGADMDGLAGPGPRTAAFRDGFLNDDQSDEEGSEGAEDLQAEQARVAVLVQRTYPKRGEKEAKKGETLQKIRERLAKILQPGTGREQESHVEHQQVSELKRTVVAPRGEEGHGSAEDLPACTGLIQDEGGQTAIPEQRVASQLFENLLTATECTPETRAETTTGAAVNVPLPASPSRRSYETIGSYNEDQPPSEAATASDVGGLSPTEWLRGSISRTTLPDLPGSQQDLAVVQGVLANVRRDNTHRIVTHTAPVYQHHSSSSTSRLTDIVNGGSDATWLNLQRRASMVSLRHRRSVLEAARRGQSEGTSAEENSRGVQTAPLNAPNPSSAQGEADTSRLRVRSPRKLTPARGESSSRFPQAVGTLSTSPSQGSSSRARLPLRSRRKIIAGRGDSLESQS